MTRAPSTRPTTTRSRSTSRSASATSPSPTSRSTSRSSSNASTSSPASASGGDRSPTDAAAGHEIGNPSFHHEPWLHRYGEAQVESELQRAEESIERATGRRPVGFRGPGFSLSAVTLEVLTRRRYLYDASTLPTFLGPLARAYYFWASSLTREERRQREALYGSFSDGWRSIRPYWWRTPAGQILEIPVTTMPGVKIPFHASYVIYLAARAPRLAMAYFEAALALCRCSTSPPSVLLHPLDFLGGDDTKDLAFFPGMSLPGARKLELLGEILQRLSARFAVV